MTSDDEPRTVSDVLAERVRRYRERAELRQDDLAARTAELGHPMSRVTLAKLEAGGTRATRATLVDVLVLAVALDVPPPLLFLPLGEAEEVAIAPGLVTHPHIALDWLAGEESLGRHIEAWTKNQRPLQMFRGLRARQNAVHSAWNRGERPDAGPDERRQLELALSSLSSWLDAMRSAGLTPPDMPGEWQVRMAELDA